MIKVTKRILLLKTEEQKKSKIKILSILKLCQFICFDTRITSFTFQKLFNHNALFCDVKDDFNFDK